MKEKAQKFLKKIETSKFLGDVKYAITDISKNLKDYLFGKTDKPRINESALQGLYKPAGLNVLGNLPVNTVNTISTTNNKIVSVTDFKYASLNLMNFDGKWLQLVGKPFISFKMKVSSTRAPKNRP